MDISEAVGQKVLLAFRGTDDLSPDIVRAIKEYRPAGISLFRSLNIEEPAQLRALTGKLQALAREIGLPPLLIAMDQEGGQLMAMGDGTPLPGNMAIGATGSEALARRAGQVLARELAAVGVNVNYAPCVDINLNPNNPVVGVRSFGEDPQQVARLGAAMIEGMQSQGTAATAKHFPGHGDTASDSHLGLPTVPHSLDRLRAVEFVPFRLAIRAGVKLVMTAHLGLPALDGPQAPPATLSAKVLQEMLRGELGYAGIIVTDALDMHAIRQGDALGGEAVRAVHAGADLLLVTSDPEDQARVHRALLDAAIVGKLDTKDLQRSAQRVMRLKHWLARQPAAPDLDSIRSREHMQVADEIAEQSITLVRDRDLLLPLRLRAEQRIAVILPKPQDLTPADTSSYITPGLARAIREYHPNVEEFSIPFAPQAEDIRLLLEALVGYDLIIVGTLNAFQQAGQAELVRGILGAEIPAIVIAMRLPYDLVAFPPAPVFLCTYGLLEPSMRAAARCLFGKAPFQGRLPASIPGLHPAGFSFNR